VRCAPGCCRWRDRGLGVPDHPTDAQLVAMARQYFKKFDAMAADPSMA
jgi:hypothetical protein